MERYAWALVSGVGIFFLGGGVSIYHGVSGLFSPHVLGDPSIAWWVLGGSLLFEGATMSYAFNTIYKSAKHQGIGVKEYILRGADPTTVQVLLEDVAGVLGVVIAATSISLSSALGMPILDSIGSITIGLLLGGVASFLVRRNIASLVERRMDRHKEELIANVLRNDAVVQSVHDVKSTMLGNLVYC
jgi:zinc transporter 9